MRESFVVSVGSFDHLELEMFVIGVATVAEIFAVKRSLTDNPQRFFFRYRLEDTHLLSFI